MISGEGVYERPGSSQFRLTVCKMFRHDKNSFGGGLCMHANESIPVK